MIDEKCIDECLACVKACEICIDGCLGEGAEMEACIRACLDCVDLCSVTAKLEARNSAFAPKLRALCVEVCEACAKECENMPIITAIVRPVRKRVVSVQKLAEVNDWKNLAKREPSIGFLFSTRVSTYLNGPKNSFLRIFKLNFANLLH